MKADEVVKALRCEENLGSEACKECVYGQKESLCFCLDSEAADLLEQLKAEIKQIAKDRDQWKVAAEASRDVIQPKLRAEIAELKASQIRRINYESCKLCDSEHACETKTIRECKDMLLKASQPVRCKDCVKRKTEDCSMYYDCECGEQHTWEVDDDYCSVGERRVEE